MCKVPGLASINLKSIIAAPFSGAWLTRSRMYETPRRAGALCSPGQKLRTIMDSSNAAMPPDSWPTGSLARLRRAVGMYVFGWADGCDPHQGLPQPWVVAPANYGVNVEANSADDIADKTNDDAMVNGSSHGRGRCTDTKSGIINGLSVSGSQSTRRQRMPGSSLRLINVKCRRESLFDVMSLDVEGSETDCSAIHCFKVFQRVNVKRGPPEQTNPRDIFLESIGNIVIWPPASMSGSQKDRDDTSDPTKPQNDPLARDLVVCALDKGGNILAESDVPVEILPPNPAMFPSAYGYSETVDKQQHDEAHADVRAFKCPDCGFEASKRNGLRVHRSRWCVTETLIQYDDGDRDWENLTALLGMKPPQVRVLGRNQAEAVGQMSNAEDSET
eukprot:g1802.t1